MTTKISLLAASLFLPVFISAQNVIPEPAQYRPAKGEFVLSIAENKALETNNVLPSRVVQRIGPDCTTGADEAYRLEITPDSVFIQSATVTGVFRGEETLKQLLRFGKGTTSACVINDAPRYSWRGFMLDESRHFFGKEKVKQLLDIMASLRLNVFHWHLTDEPGWRIEIKKYPLLTKVGSKGNYHDPSAPAAFYTQEDIKDIVAYAAARHIMIVPEFDMPGHATAACRAYPELSGGGEGRWKDFTFHPCKEETFRFINDVLDELITLFPSPYIHIGGDEVHFGNQEWFIDPQIQQFIKDKQLMNETGLEQYFVRRVADIIAAKGKTMIGWDEIVDAGVSPDKAVVMWWRHDRRYQLLKALESGYRVIMTPRRPMYGDFVQYSTHNVGRYWDGYNPIEDVFSFPRSIEHLFKGYESQIMGMQYSLWTERVADVKRLDFMVFPRLVAAAEAAWTPAVRKDYSRFMRRLPFFLHWLDTKDIYYFDPFAPERRPEPTAPEKEDVLQNG
ncbi:beta-N-acetylhexosaminidase [Bacteroides sp.]|uniref:beta-N-acetylhexosaminidase n=1 Tax=Bacteroides sp. TaxID=29523 RepID=UPI0025BEE135|nr:beta-N-acetylhexosaminidase [Bacteroides sp.]